MNTHSIAGILSGCRVSVRDGLLMMQREVTIQERCRTKGGSLAACIKIIRDAGTTEQSDRVRKPGAGDASRWGGLRPASLHAVR
jgi:hypothetical protein